MEYVWSIYGVSSEEERTNDNITCKGKILFIRQTKNKKSPDKRTCRDPYLFYKNLFLLVEVVECSNAVEFNLIEELICCAKALCLKAISSNLVLLHKNILNGFSTSL